MSDWTKRLQRVQAEMPRPETEDIDHMTLEMLLTERVRFGKAHQGKSYAEVWESAPDWIRWFLGHYQESKDVEHKKMIRFIKLRIEETEASGGEVPQPAPVKAKVKAAPKILAASAKSRSAPHPDACPEEPVNAEMSSLQARMTSLEHALHQILVHLTRNVPADPVPSTMDDDLPVLPLASEWEDPWTA